MELAEQVELVPVAEFVALAVTVAAVLVELVAVPVAELAEPQEVFAPFPADWIQCRAFAEAVAKVQAVPRVTQL